MSEAKSADELYKFVSDYFMNNNKHNLTREEFYHWLAQYETKDLQRLSELEIKLNTVEQEVTEVKNHAFDEDQYHRKFDSFFYRTILPKVGEIIDREKGRTLEALDRVKNSVSALDQNTVKKSNLTKYISAAVGIIFTGGIGSTWTAVYDMQQKLDQVPVLVQNVEELQEERRNTEKQLFVIEGAATTLKDRFNTLEENELKLRSTLQQLESSVQTNAYSITDVLERLSAFDDPNEKFN
jgi:chromosome segregation ATPase